MNRTDQDVWWRAAGHGFAGRMVGPDRDKNHDAFPVVSYCLCGLGFFGFGAAEADHRFSEHLIPATGQTWAEQEEGR
jgi:hypothetical protein